MSRKLLGLTLALTLLAGLFVTPGGVSAEGDMVGKYIRFGKYNGEDVLYKIIQSKDVDADGTNEILLLSDRVITFKAFDALGDNIGNRESGQNRMQQGSNFWKESNIRDWLNSSDSAVNWTGLAPTSGRLWSVYNPYAEEKGFLADGNMTPEERSCIVPVTQTTVISVTDEALKTEGTVPHTVSEGGIDGAISNFSAAYKTESADKVFLPSLVQIKYLVKDVDSGFLAGKPTQKALDNHGYVPSPPYTTDSAVPYLLRDANASNAHQVRRVGADNTISSTAAFSGTSGIRPAMYLKTDMTLEGSGTKEDPYVPVFPRRLVTTSDFSKIAGGYIKFGKYNNADVLYRIVKANDVDGDGSDEVMLFSDSVISFKAFDAKGDNIGSRDTTNNRMNYGSNFWAESNLRMWLNSQSLPVTWGAMSPSGSYVWDGYNPYANEAGFLSNWTENEKSAVIPVENLTIASTLDIGVQGIVGSEAHAQNTSSLANAIQNYDTAYKMVTEDKVFALSVKELKEINEAYPGIIRGYPTQQAIDQSNYGAKPATPSVQTMYWLRDANATSGMNTWRINADGSLNNASNAFAGVVGVRPALYIKAGMILLGTGTKDDPYTIFQDTAPAMPLKKISHTFAVDRIETLYLEEGMVSCAIDLVNVDQTEGYGTTAVMVLCKGTDEEYVVEAVSVKSAMLGPQEVDTLRLSITVDDTDERFVKVFLWNSLGRMQPLAASFGLYARAENIMAIVQNADIASGVARSVVEKAGVDGVTLYTSFLRLQPQENQYDFANLDYMINLCETNNKSLKIAVLGGRWVPEWIYEKGAQKFTWTLTQEHVEQGTTQASAPVPWDDVYLTALENLLARIDTQYSGRKIISGFQITGPALVNGLEMNLSLSASDTARIGFTEEKFTGAWKRMIDFFSQRFQNQRLSLCLHDDIGALRRRHLAREVRAYAYSRIGGRFSPQVAYLTHDTWFAPGNATTEIWADAYPEMKLEAQVINKYSQAYSAGELYQTIAKAVAMNCDFIEIFAEDFMDTDCYEAILRTREDFFKPSN